METKQIKEQIEAVAKAFEDFKASNDAALSETAKKGHVDTLIKQARDNANDEITKLTEKLDAFAAEKDALEKAIKRQQGDVGVDVKAAEFGKMLGAEMDAKGVDEYSKAMQSYLRRGIVEKALSVVSDPDGGYFVKPESSARIVNFVNETSPMRQVASVVNIGSDAIEGLYDLGEADAGWVGETDSRSDTTTPKIGTWRIPVHEIYAKPKITQKLLDDAGFNIEGWLEGKVRRKFVRMENEAFVAGDGVMKPRGFTTYAEGTPSATSYEKIAIQKTGVSGNWAATNPADTLIKTVYALKQEYAANGTWAMRRSLEGEVREFKTANGYIWQPDFTQKNGRSLLGYPVVNFEDMPAKGANSLSIAFGDFAEAYQIVDRLGVRVLRDPFTAKPYVVYYTTKRVGGAVVNFDALILVKFIN